ncbi:chemotaxis protein CheW [Paenibacillus tarimensis]
MSANNTEHMTDLYLFEALQMIEQFEQCILTGEQSGGFTALTVNEIFRVMHTLKGSSAMMMYNNIAELAHEVEDLFFFIREKQPVIPDFSVLSDLALSAADFTKGEIAKIRNGSGSDGDHRALLESFRAYLQSLMEEHSNPASMQSNEETRYLAVIYFDEGCEMENVRAYSVIHRLQNCAEIISYEPADIVENPESAEMIRSAGFRIRFRTCECIHTLNEMIQETLFLRDMKIEIQQPERTDSEPLSPSPKKENLPEQGTAGAGKLGMINVSVDKLDSLMDLVGELVISEAMVTQHPELDHVNMDNFQKAIRQLRKIIGELQDAVMSIRLISLSSTFQRMNRIVRDMSRKLNKEVRLELIGEETEVDKNIIERISDPLMHLIRNAIDHGIEPVEQRIASGKPEAGTIALEAFNAGGDVMILIKDDGRGLDREKILEKARDRGLIDRPEHELTDRDIYSFIFMPGFSTNESVTEHSGRGVGTDVAMRNVQELGGTITVDSHPGRGAVFWLKIPLTLASIDGMTVQVGCNHYTIPTTSIRESFKVAPGEVIRDPDGNEMLLVRGKCHRIVRLHQWFQVDDAVRDIHDGIIIMAESQAESICLLADRLIGKQQVVVKSLPAYLKKIRGIAGCTLLGDGSISLILDVSEFNRSY